MNEFEGKFIIHLHQYLQIGSKTWTSFSLLKYQVSKPVDSSHIQNSDYRTMRHADTVLSTESMLICYSGERSLKYAWKHRLTYRRLGRSLGPEEHLLFLQRTKICFSTSTWQFTTVYNSSSRRSYALSGLPRQLHMESHAYTH